MPTNQSYGLDCSSCSGCMAFGTIRPIALSPLSRIPLSGDLPLVSLGPVRVLDARLSTRGIPRRSRSRAGPLLALWVQGSRGTASERITTISLDSTRSQLFCNGTGLWAPGASVGQQLCLEEPTFLDSLEVNEIAQFATVGGRVASPTAVPKPGLKVSLHPAPQCCAPCHGHPSGDDNHHLGL